MLQELRLQNRGKNYLHGQVKLHLVIDSFDDEILSFMHEITSPIKSVSTKVDSSWVDIHAVASLLKYW